MHCGAARPAVSDALLKEATTLRHEEFLAKFILHWTAESVWMFRVRSEQISRRGSSA